MERVGRRNSCLFLDQFLRLLNLLLRSSNDERFPILRLFHHSRTRHFLNLHKGARFFLYKSDIFAAFSDDDSCPVGRHWIFHAVLADIERVTKMLTSNKLPKCCQCNRKILGSLILLVKFLNEIFWHPSQIRLIRTRTCSLIDCSGPGHVPPIFGQQCL